jgi:hypothetical protein
MSTITKVRFLLTSECGQKPTFENFINENVFKSLWDFPATARVWV